jgi:pyrimidine operon attenuation protein/uracil phosphoribosyltransferase
MRFELVMQAGPSSKPITMESKRNLIFDDAQIRQKIKRIAYEILEDHYGESELVLAGVCDMTGSNALAERLADELESIAEFRVLRAAIRLDKRHPATASVHLELEDGEIDNRAVVVVDDVANSGRVLFYALKPLLAHKPSKVRVAVLVDRKHKAFPISPDYIGTQLATTMHEHITVELKPGAEAVFLS